MAVSRLTQTTLQNGFEKFGRVWDGRSAVGAMEAISSITLSANQASIEFNNIPSTYTHLQIRGIVRSAQANSTIDSFSMRLNGDSGSNYAWHFLQGNGASATAAAGADRSLIIVGGIPSDSHTSGFFAAFVIDMLDYANTSKFKTVRSLGGVDTNNTGTEVGVIRLSSGLWRNTNAVTSVSFAASSGFDRNVTQHTTFALYGIR